MAEVEIYASKWRLVEVGRVVVFAHGPYVGRLAAIVEIIDHKRVCLCCPSLACTERHVGFVTGADTRSNIRFWWTAQQAKTNLAFPVKQRRSATLYSHTSLFQSYHEPPVEGLSHARGKRPRSSRNGQKVQALRGKHSKRRGGL